MDMVWLCFCYILNVTTSSFLNKLPNFAYCVLEIKNVFGEYFWYFGSNYLQNLFESTLHAVFMNGCMQANRGHFCDTFPCYLVIQPVVCKETFGK